MSMHFPLPNAVGQVSGDHSEEEGPLVKGKPSTLGHTVYTPGPRPPQNHLVPLTHLRAHELRRHRSQLCPPCAGRGDPQLHPLTASGPLRRAATAGAAAQAGTILQRGL